MVITNITKKNGKQRFTRPIGHVLVVGVVVHDHSINTVLIFVITFQLIPQLKFP